MIVKKYQQIYLDNSKLELLRKENFHEYFKSQIFKGKIFIIKNNEFILKIIDLVKKILNIHLSKEENSFLFKNKNSTTNFSNLRKRFFECQKLVKQNIEIKIEFKKFLKFLNFNISNTKSDLICVRYIKSNDFSIGNLNFVKGHRDTWASNLQEQINWWFPLNKTDPSNTIYLGDHINDLKAGLSAGVKVLGCLYGYSLDENNLKKLNYPYIRDVSEIYSHINIYILFY